VGENLWAFTPLVLPFHGSAMARRLNRRWLRRSLLAVLDQLGFERPITWTFVPSSADVVGSLGEQLTIYHCVDEYTEFTGADAGIAEMERRLLAKSDLVLVSAGPLYEDKRRFNPNTFLVTHGVDVAHFGRALDPGTPIAPELGHLSRPVIGFFGLIEDWVDLDLIRAVAQARPQWSMVLVGKARTSTEAVDSLPNVHLVGWRDYGTLPAWCKGFDVAILPFRINRLTLAANPLKLREYLAAGLPVVATAIPEAERLASVRIGRTPEGFVREIDRLVAAGTTGPSAARAQAMRTESWDHKVEEMCAVVQGFLGEPARRREMAR
jgi:glycosyltransferase involved in cell wall biosynthesis